MGTQTWEQLRAKHGDGFEWMWQDLDGLHLASLPEQPPLTSILWGWPRLGAGDAPPVTELIRVRLDGNTVYAASPAAGTPGAVLPWDGLNQVDQFRSADGLSGDVFRTLKMVEVTEPLPDDGSVPLVFLCRRM